MRTVVVVVAALLGLTTAAGGCGDVTLPDSVTPGEIAGASGSDWWLGMPVASQGEFVLDARLTRSVQGALQTIDTIDFCRGNCRHIGYGGNGLLAVDHKGEGIQLVDTAPVDALPFPLEEEEQPGPWLLAARNATLIAAAGTRVFQRDGTSWTELPELDAPVFSVVIEPSGVLVAQRDTPTGRFPAALVGEEWIAHDEDIEEDALVAFAPDGSFASSQSIPAPAADAFVPLRMFSSGLLAARLVGTTLDAVIVDESGTATTWASLGSADAINPLSFRATVFDDGTVGVLYPGGPRSEGVGPKTLLHVGDAP
jgi:hypothetical protein